MLRSSKENVYWTTEVFSLSAPGMFLYLVTYLGNRVYHVFQKTARILAVTAITMFLEAIARQWILSNKNARKAVDFARYNLASVHCL